MSVARSLIQHIKLSTLIVIQEHAWTCKLPKYSGTENMKTTRIKIIKDISLVMTWLLANYLPLCLSRSNVSPKREKGPKTKFLAAARRKKEKFLFLCTMKAPKTERNILKKIRSVWWSRSHWHRISKFRYFWCVYSFNRHREKTPTWVCGACRADSIAPSQIIFNRKIITRLEAIFGERFLPPNSFLKWVEQDRSKESEAFLVC